MARLAKGKLLV